MLKTSKNRNIDPALAQAPVEEQADSKLVSVSENENVDVCESECVKFACVCA